MTAEQRPIGPRPVRLTTERIVPNSDLLLLGEASLMHGVVVNETKTAGEAHVTQETIWLDEGARHVIRGTIIPENHTLVSISGAAQTLPSFWREVEDLRAGRESRQQSIKNHL